jgi:flagellar protein FlaG
MIDKVTGSATSFTMKTPTEAAQPNVGKVKDIPAEVKLQAKPPKEEMEKIVQGMNDFLKPSPTHLKFEFHDELEEYYITMVDDVTHEVIKEIPSKKLLDMYAAMTDYLGILVDKKI